jgi:molybdate-binding protein/DNA-binding CsgD family transcriptional regulator
MNRMRRIQDFESLKIIADERKQAILRLLMAGPETLSSLGKILGDHPAQVRYHLKQLEKIGLVELAYTRPERGYVEKYYRATARAFFFQGAVLPWYFHSDRESLVFLGSHDLALEMLVKEQEQVLAFPVGSLEGLVALRQGNAHLAGCHLLDAPSGEFNLPFVRHFFPDREITLITLAYREQGLLVAPDNPHHVHKLEDLAHKDVTTVLRNPGSGTRVWFDRQISRLGLSPQVLRRTANEAQTHTAVAKAVQDGTADAGIALRAAAIEAGLDFIPLFQERYDLIIPNDNLENPDLVFLLEKLHSGKFRKQMQTLEGYETSHTGDRIDSNK